MMIIMTLKIITEIVNQIKTKEKKKRNNKSQTKTHTKRKRKKNGSRRIQQQEQNKKTKTKKNKYSVTKMEQRDAKGSADSQNLISIFEKHHRCPN